MFTSIVVGTAPALDFLRTHKYFSITGLSGRSTGSPVAARSTATVMCGARGKTETTTPFDMVLRNDLDWLGTS
jgi:hypothetical protein